MHRKISHAHDPADGPESLDPAIKEISEALAQDAARRELRFAAQFAPEEGAKPKRKPSGSSHQPNASNVLPMSDAGKVWERKIPGKCSSLEPTAVDVAESMFVASAQLVLATLEELKAHAAAVRTKEEVDDILAVQIERWREAVTQFRAERSRRFAQHLDAAKAPDDAG
jgi:hypothetical protein